jgi:hypothetical protein
VTMDSIVLLWAQNNRAHRWLVENTSRDRQWWDWRALVVEPRYVADIIEGARESGLEVR